MSKFAKAFILCLGLAGCAHAPPAPQVCTPPAEAYETNDAGTAAIVACQWMDHDQAVCGYRAQTRDHACSVFFVRQACHGPWAFAHITCHLTANENNDETL
jgi:hypothetical protein